MVSESMMSGSLSKSMGPIVSSAQTNCTDKEESKRKRHKSAGDHTYLKTRSNSLLPSWRMSGQGSEETEKFSELVTRENQENIIENVAPSTDLEFQKSEMLDISEEIKDSGVGLDENEVGGDEEELAERLGATGISMDNSETGSDSTVTRECSIDSSEGLTNEVSGKKLDSISEIKSRSGSLKSSATSSPVHVVATPVTENDPLGLFMEPPGESTPSANNSRASSVSKSSPEKNRESFVAKKPFEDEKKLPDDTVKCNIEESSSNEASNIVGSSGKVLSPLTDRQRNKFNLERTSSFPENLGNSATGEETPRKSNFNPEVASLGRSSSSLHEGKVERSGLFRTGSFRRHKNNFSGMLKFATGAVANKLSELKVSMTPSKLGSNSSLTPSYDDFDSEDEGSRESARKKGSLDFLHRSIDDRLDTNSMNGLHGRYHPIVVMSPLIYTIKYC